VIVAIDKLFTFSTSANLMLPSFEPTDLRLPLPDVNMVRLAYDNTEVGESGLDALLGSLAGDSGMFSPLPISETTLVVAVLVTIKMAGGDLEGDTGLEREEDVPEEKVGRGREAGGRGEDEGVELVDSQGGACPKGGEVSRL